MNKVFYEFSDNSKFYSLDQAKKHKEETGENWKVNYEYVPMPVNAVVEGGNVTKKNR